MPDFSSISETAIYKKISEAVGVSIDNTITELDNTKSIINNTLYTQRFGKGGFYVTTAKAFQYGDALIADPETGYPIYETIDTTKQIISQASYEKTTLNGHQRLSLKVATLDSSNALIKLSTAQYAAFISYMENFLIDGVYVDIVSLDANTFNFVADVKYYTAYDLTTLQNNITAALQTFKTNFQFNGVLYVNDLESYLTANVPGIRNVFLSGTTITDAFGNVVSFSNYTSLSAGYFNFDPSISFSYVKI